MSIRITGLYICIAALSICAWKDWFKSLCGFIVILAFLEHPDMPSRVMGIQGLNPMNFLMLVVLLAWFRQRQQEGGVLDMPQGVKRLLGLYFLIIFISFIRMMADRSMLWPGIPNSVFISDFLINTYKWVIPGLLLFYGCRTRERAKLALLALLLLGFFFAFQVSIKIPSGYAFSGSDDYRRRKLDREIGYNATDLSTILAGVSWSMFVMTKYSKKRWIKVLLLLTMIFVVYCQALSGGRAGYLAWGVTGLFLCLIKWRKYLILAPIVVVLLAIIFPGAANRMLVGFGSEDISGDSTVDFYAVTSGRWEIWPLVIEKIGESPIIGYGRHAMLRTGLAREIRFDLGDSFPHPHNAYLEFLLDNGFVGFIPVMTFYVVIIIYAIKLFRDRTEPLYSAIGGITLAFVMTQLIGSIGAQSFYPKEGTVAMWCAIGLTIRMTVERSKATNVTFAQDYQYYPLPELSQVSYYYNLK